MKKLRQNVLFCRGFLLLGAAMRLIVMITAVFLKREFKYAIVP